MGEEDIKPLGLADGQPGPWQIWEHPVHASDRLGPVCDAHDTALPSHPDTPFSIRTGQRATVFLAERSEPTYRMDSSYLPAAAAFGKQRRRRSN